MLKINKLINLRTLFFFPFLLLALYSFYVYKNFRIQQKRQAINNNIGKKFPGLPLLSANGETVLPDYSTAENTIIDFWYRNCPFCLAEMKQFETILSGKEKQVAIISISIDDAATWHSVIGGKEERFAFLKKNVSNWHHLLLNYDSGAAYNNNNARQLAAQLNVTSYPSFFVLDKQGIITATPQSAVAFIQKGGNEQQSFPQFLSRPGTWFSLYMILFLPLCFFIYRFISGLPRVLKNR